MGDERKGARDDDGIKWNKKGKEEEEEEEEEIGESIRRGRGCIARSTFPLGSGTDDFPGLRSKGRPHVRVNSHRVIFHEPFRFVDGRPREE